MKKAFKSWKIWTILSAFVFSLAFGMFVTQATWSSNSNWTFANKYKTGIIDNILTAEKWNEFVNDLDKLIPEGAILAFALEEGCPNWRTQYTWANGRFLMGATSDIWGFWWNNSIKLTANQLPQHQHEIKYRNKNNFGDDSSRRSIVVDWISEETPSGAAIGGGKRWTERMLVQTAPNWNNWWGSATPDSINITNPYVKVHFCVKWDYTISDSCPSGYNINTKSCANWFIFHSQTSMFGNTCWMCEKAYCQNWMEECSLNGANLWGNVYRQELYWNTCVNPGCCVSSAPSRTGIHQNIDLSSYYWTDLYPKNGTPKYESIIANYCSN